MKQATLLMLLLLSFSVQANDVEIPFDSIKGPTCVVLDTVTQTALPFAPERSKYNVTVSDGIAEITLVQMYVNRFTSISSIAYIFPLPHKGSVNSMKMLYNDSIYTAEIYEKEEAQDIYDSLTGEGKSAALLLQERPNIFQQQIANIGVGDTAFIEITTTLPLNYVDSIYELRIPTMVAERYGSTRSSGSKWNPPATVGGNSLLINVLLQTDFAVRDLESPTHPIRVSQVESIREELDNISLLEKDAVLSQEENQGVLLVASSSYNNTDYILRFKRSSSAAEISMASYFDQGRGNGYFAMNIFPDELLDEDSLLSPREILFMFDISGSQGGWPIEKQKEVVNHILDKLSPSDRISALAFNGSQTWAFAPFEVRDATDNNITVVRNFINGLRANGGTELLSAIDTYLKTPQTTEMSRYFIFLTDGFITNEENIFDRIESDPSDPTIFTFGAGNNLNHYFLETCAEIGNGFSIALSETESAESAVDAGWGRIISPQLDNIDLNFGSAAVEDLIFLPSRKLYKGMPVTCYGRYKNGGNQTVEVSGYRDGSPLSYEKEASFATGATQNRMIPKLWAKQKIEQLDLEDGVTENNKDEIIALSVEYQVLSKYTAFLAINPESVNGDNIVDTSWSTDIMEIGKIQKGLSIRQMSGHLQLDFPADVGLQMFSIFDLRGRLLFQVDLSQVTGTSYIWNGDIGGASLASGAYIVAVQTQKGVITSKLNWRR